jgi:pyruvate, water dikinase
MNSPYIYWFEDLSMADISVAGGKNASLGEMTQSLGSAGVPVPPGFATSANLYREFLTANQLDEPIAQTLTLLSDGDVTLQHAGSRIRKLIQEGEFTQPQRDAISEAYDLLGERVGDDHCDVAVRSSATAEDLPEASFAGQQESYLNVRGASAVLDACRFCFASLFTDRAITYREEQGFAHSEVALSVGVQKMVRSDRASAGVMFTIDTESGFPDAIMISGAWGLGESVVKGIVTPDRYMVYKPFLTNPTLTPIIEQHKGSKLSKLVYGSLGTSPDSAVLTLDTDEEERHTSVLTTDEILILARWGALIEQHYGHPMDIEWAKDGVTDQLYIVQARPETVESQKDRSVLVRYSLTAAPPEVLLQGASVGSAIANGPVCYLSDPSEIDQFPSGSILLADRTDPDWVPVMQKAAGIITNAGGTTSHAAIVSRELKVPAIVGSGNGTTLLRNTGTVTMDCSEGAVGKVYAGALDFDTEALHLADIPRTKTDIMINVAVPDTAFSWWQLPVSGIGLTRIEFIISSQIRVHPMALLKYAELKDPAVVRAIDQLTYGYKDKAAYFVDRLATGISKVAASQYPRPVIVRMSDFKSNEYRGLLGGELFEPQEENPMLGLRGASRYYHPVYREAFLLECKAIRRVREDMGFRNVIVMIPFCRTPAEADKVLGVMAEAGLVRGNNELQVYVMCEIPSNIILAEEFAARFDGFSIGSNDLTQLVLGIDRDSAELKSLFDARDPAVKKMIAHVIEVAHKMGCKVGICGQAPSDHPEFAAFLVECGIDSISLNPDSVAHAAQHIYKAETG